MIGKKMCNKNSLDMKTRSMTKKEKAKCKVRVREIDTNLPRNLDTRRTFFQGSQVSTKQPK